MTPDPQRKRALEVADSYLDDIRHTDDRDWREKLADLLLAFAQRERADEALNCADIVNWLPGNFNQRGNYVDALKARAAQLESAQPAKGRG